MIFRNCVVSFRLALLLLVHLVEASAQKASHAKPFERLCVLDPEHWPDISDLSECLTRRRIFLQQMGQKKWRLIKRWQITCWLSVSCIFRHRACEPWHFDDCFLKRSKITPPQTMENLTKTILAVLAAGIVSVVVFR